VPKAKAAKTKAQQAKETSEASITEDVLGWLNAQPKTYAHKTHGGMYGVKGKPDITGCHMGWRFEIEMKKPGGVVSTWQERELTRWAGAGAFVAVAYSLAEVQAFWKAWGFDKS
jgi:hypothetical protein